MVVDFMLSLKCGNILSLMCPFVFQFCRKCPENTGEELQAVSTWGFLKPISLILI